MKAILSGFGNMGKALLEVSGECDVSVVAMVGDGEKTAVHPPLYSYFSQCDEQADIIIDFSSPTMLVELLEFSVNRRLPLLIGTTAYTKHQINLLRQASRYIPILLAENYSPAALVMNKLAGVAADMLCTGYSGSDSTGGYDIHITEHHHRYKKDAPSATALALKQAACGDSKDDTTVCSFRGGNTAGSHEITFSGYDECLTITHRVYSRNVYARGALSAAKELLNRPNGFYSLADINR